MAVFTTSRLYPRGVILVAIWALLLTVGTVFYQISTSCEPSNEPRLMTSLRSLVTSRKPTKSAAMWPAFAPSPSNSPAVEDIRQSFASSGDFYESLPVMPLAPEKPADAPYSAVILYMLDSRASRVWDTLASLETLARNVPFEHPYPILFLQSGDFDDPVLQDAMVARWLERIDELHLASEKPSVLQRMETMAELIEFVRVDFTPNLEALRAGVEGLKPFFPTVWPGYHSMCRFFTVEVFKHPRIRDLDYYMRMDTDSFMPKELAYDPIALAHRRGLKYLGRSIGFDAGVACHGMWDFVEEFADAHPGVAERMARNDLPIPDQTPDRIEAPISAWYNNFEVAHVPSFRRPDVAEWLKTLNTFWRGFYVHRWGDAGLRRFTAAMFFEPEEVRELCSWDYFHRVEPYEATCAPEVDMRARNQSRV
ncbi:hypothetical protein EHS25_003929 [Saitozyma podzolica]|uniref:Alpha 1,2-mannosyltransferase 2.4.1 n=1 Tax=Saitozyma podzolica TaxID=1890683 RepID=A0A427Y3Y0_9TREE|nr:hypothetical protein EHS25_003929 [Saitozyma podzolica]